MLRSATHTLVSFVEPNSGSERLCTPGCDVCTLRLDEGGVNVTGGCARVTNTLVVEGLAAFGVLSEARMWVNWYYVSC